MKTIYLAGGCFWGVEDYFQRTYGVSDVVSGYANGLTDNPTYEAVCYEGTDHAETVKISYDPARVTLEYLLYRYMSIIDPTSLDQQGNDRGRQYRTGIYYESEDDRQVAERVLSATAKHYTKPLVVELKPIEHFYDAESYHQNYLVKNPMGYCHIHQDPEAVFIPADLYRQNSHELSPKAQAIAYHQGTEAPSHTAITAWMSRGSMSMPSPVSRCSRRVINTTPCAAGPAFGRSPRRSSPSIPMTRMACFGPRPAPGYPASIWVMCLATDRSSGADFATASMGQCFALFRRTT